MRGLCHSDGPHSVSDTHEGMCIADVHVTEEVSMGLADLLVFVLLNNTILSHYAEILYKCKLCLIYKQLCVMWLMERCSQLKMLFSSLTACRRKRNCS